MKEDTYSITLNVLTSDSVKSMIAFRELSEHALSMAGLYDSISITSHKTNADEIEEDVPPRYTDVHNKAYRILRDEGYSYGDAHFIIDALIRSGIIFLDKK